MTNKVDISVVIPNYNTKELLGKCLSSIFRSKTDNLQYEIIVVDNNSSDDSITMVKRNYSQVLLIANKNNDGFAIGNNLGIKIVKGEYVLLLNPDTELEENTLITMVNFMENHFDVGIATCRVELANGQIDDASHRGFPTPWNAFCHFSGLGKIFPNSTLFNGYHLGYRELNQIHEIDACVGAFMLIRRKVGEKLNWLDEDYYWYGEDLDFCYRVKQNGWKVMYVPLTKILHWKGASSGIRKESNKVTTANLETRKRAAKASTEAMRIFYRKHYLRKYPTLITNLVLKGIDYIENKRISKLK